MVFPLGKKSVELDVELVIVEFVDSSSYVISVFLNISDILLEMYSDEPSSTDTVHTTPITLTTLILRTTMLCLTGLTTANNLSAAIVSKCRMEDTTKIK